MNSCTDAVFAASGGSLFQSVTELGKNENLNPVRNML